MTQQDQKILIIGTGTFGASTAYHLAKRGYTNITCIDKWPYPSLDSAGYDIVSLFVLSRLDRCSF